MLDSPKIMHSLYVELQDMNGSMHAEIQGSLLGFYVCFITTSLGTVVIDLLLRLCTTFQVPNYCYCNSC